MEKLAKDQDYAPEWDLVVASNVIHATSDIKSQLSAGVILGTFSDFWKGDLDRNLSRTDGPFLSSDMWRSVLPQSGFSGLDFTLDDYTGANRSGTVVCASTIESPLSIPATLLDESSALTLVNHVHLSVELSTPPRLPSHPPASPKLPFPIVLEGDYFFTLLPSLLSCYVILSTYNANDHRIHRSPPSIFLLAFREYLRSVGSSVDMVTLEDVKNIRYDRLLFLVEFERPLFLDITSAEWTGLQISLGRAGSALWVTSGGLWGGLNHNLP
ncbi:MAG: hypothetical protein Q9188_006648 [Gyalolechia gomerana]